MCFERVGVLGAKSEGYFRKIAGSGKAAVDESGVANKYGRWKTLHV